LKTCLNPSLDDLTDTVDADSNETQQKKNDTDKSNLLAEQSACRERLQVIRDKTYLVQDTAVLSRVRSLLDNIILDMQ